RPSSNRCSSLLVTWCVVATDGGAGCRWVIGSAAPSRHRRRRSPTARPGTAGSACRWTGRAPGRAVAGVAQEGRRLGGRGVLGSRDPARSLGGGGGVAAGWGA